MSGSAKCLKFRQFGTLLKCVNVQNMTSQIRRNWMGRRGNLPQVLAGTKDPPYVSTTIIMAMGCWQCLPLSVVQLKDKLSRKPHCSTYVLAINLFHTVILE